MKKIKEKLKNNSKLIIGIIVGAIFINVIGVGIAVAAGVAASDVVYTGNSQSTVKGALDDLYTKASTHCPTGYSCTKTTTTQLVWTPKYYAFGVPTTSSSTSYSSLGKNVFLTLANTGTYGVCNTFTGSLLCLNFNDSISTNKTKIASGANSCTTMSDGRYMCYYSSGRCDVYTTTGYVYCIQDLVTAIFSCGNHDGGTPACYSEYP